MADINITRGGPQGGHVGRRNQRTVYNLTRIVKGADVRAAKGSALANGDVVKVFNIPAGSVALFGGLEVLVADTGSDVRGALGTPTDDDQFVAPVSIASTGVKTSVFTPENPFAAATTLDFTLSQSSAFDTDENFVVKIWATFADTNAFEDATSADASTTD